LPVESFEIIAAGAPSRVFDEWIETLKRAGVEAKQVGIVDYDREHGHNPSPHTRGNEVYTFISTDRLEESGTFGHTESAYIEYPIAKPADRCLY